MSFAAPRSKDGLTASFLTSLLQEEGVLGREAAVEAVAVEDVGVGRGYLCQAVRITPTYVGAADGAPASMVAKVPTFMEWPDRFMPLMTDMIHAEHCWYREEQPRFPARAPQRFGSVFESREAHALRLEDCGALTHFSQTDACSAETAQLIVEHLARAQAHWWEDPRLGELDWLPSVEQSVQRIEPIVQRAWGLFAQRIVPRVDPAFVPIGERIVERFGDLLREGAASASTLVHGDFRLKNVLMGERGGEDEVVILDWQLISHGSGLRDFAYFLGQNLEAETRRAAEPDLLDAYHAALVAHGVRGYSRARCETDYRLGLLIAMWIPLLGTRGFEDVAEPAADAGEEAWESHRKVMDAGEALIAEMASRNIETIMHAKAGELVGVPA